MSERGDFGRPALRPLVAAALFALVPLPATAQPEKTGGATFHYHDLYREKLAAMNVAFFSYEGRGIRMGSEPPRYELIDWEAYSTSTLAN